MFRTIPLTIAFLLAVSSCAVAALAADRLTGFQSVNPDLPFGDLAFPDGQAPKRSTTTAWRAIPRRWS